MTHFTVAIIIPPDEIDNAIAFVDHQMLPYDETKAVAPYVCYSLEQAASDIASTIHRLELIISRQEQFYDLDACRIQIEELRRTTPEQKYQECKQHYETFNAKGEPMSRYNPVSKWDWYVVGGRWDGWINDHETNGEQISNNIASTEDVIARNKIPHAIITPDGVWHEHGRMGWWGILTTENEHWNDEARGIFARYSKHQVVLVDAHI